MIQHAWLLPSVVVTTYAILFLVERVAPLRAASRRLLPRVLINLSMSALVAVTAAVTVRPGVEQAFALSAENTFGILALFGLPTVVEFCIAFLLFDWSFYWWHRANHRIPLLWRFHNVHHIDPDLDVTTASRFHAIEIAYSAIFRVAQVLVIGPAIWMYVVYELVFQLSTLFHHSNIQLPIKIERMINRVFVTPRMHGIHHSQYHNETDSNYSTVFSWWDRLHRSLRLNARQGDIQIGVPGYSLPKDNCPLNLLAMPFRQQRAYWRSSNGGPMEERALTTPTDQLQE